MNNFWTLIRFEYKKIFLKKSVVIAAVLALGITLFSCVAMIIGSNTQGDYYTEEMSNYDAMKLDKAYEKKIAGRLLDSELILEASKAYQKIDKNAENYSKTESYQKHARKYSSVYSLAASVYGSSGGIYGSRGSSLGLDRFQKLSQEEAENYYAIREEQIKKSLTNASSTDADKILKMDEDVQKPFVMQYKDGYLRFFALSVILILAILFLISFTISPIFSSEYSRNMDSLILASKNGKKSFVYAKIFTSVSVCFLITFIFMVSNYLTCMGIYGFDGATAQIQTHLPMLTYDLTYGEAAILLGVTSLLGALLHTAICMGISVLVKNSIIPMAISSILIIAGMFNGLQIPVFEELRYFLPMTMGSFYDVITQRIITFFGVSLPMYQAVSLAAIAISLVICLLSVKAFKNHQVA